MNFKQLNNKDVLTGMASAVKTEKEALITVLRYLKEVDQRRLYCDLKYSSLCQFMIKEHGYSEPEALSRIAAMRLLQDLPELEEKITNNEINLTSLNHAQTLFRQEKIQGNAYSKDQKLEVIEMLEGKSTREVKSITFSLSSKPQNLRPDKITQVSETKIEITLTANLSLETKIKDIKGLKAHQNPNLSLGEIFEELADFYLKEKARSKEKSRQRRQIESCKATLQKDDLNNATRANEESCVINKDTHATPYKSYAAAIRDVFAKAQDKCENCKSTYAVQTDHIKARAIGGTDDRKNLRALCRNCNQRAAIITLGQKKMDRYLNQHWLVL